MFLGGNVEKWCSPNLGMADNPTDSYTFTIEGPDGASDTVTVPAGAIERLREPDEVPAAVLGDFAMLMATQQIHGMVHHSHGDPDPELSAVEEAILECFEDRFGRSFAEMTGHDH